MSVLKTNNLKKYYGSNVEVKAIDNVNFSVEAGEFVSVVGSSGSGKSTLLHMIGGLDRPTGGTVEINGNQIYSMKDEIAPMHIYGLGKMAAEKSSQPTKQVTKYNLSISTDRFVSLRC